MFNIGRVSVVISFFVFYIINFALLLLYIYVTYSVKMTSDNEFLARIFDSWRAGDCFSIQHMDLNLSQQDLQNN